MLLSPKCENLQGWRPQNFSVNLLQCLITLTMDIVFPWSRQISFPCENSLSCFWLSALIKVWLCLLYSSLLDSWWQQFDPPSAFFSPGWTNVFWSLYVTGCSLPSILVISCYWENPRLDAILEEASQGKKKKEPIFHTSWVHFCCPVCCYPSLP